MVVTRAEICSFSFFLVVQVQRCLCVLGKKTPLESICEKFTGEVVCACVLCYHDHRVVVVCAPTIVSCMWMLPAGDAGNMICEMFAGTPRGP